MIYTDKTHGFEFECADSTHSTMNGGTVHYWRNNNGVPFANPCPSYQLAAKINRETMRGKKKSEGRQFDGEA